MRRSAIYNNYRALIDPTAGGGYGTLYGPNVDINGNVIQDAQGHIGRVHRQAPDQQQLTVHARRHNGSLPHDAIPGHP